MPLFDDDGRPSLILHHVVDVTEASGGEQSFPRSDVPGTERRRGGRGVYRRGRRRPARAGQPTVLAGGTAALFRRSRRAMQL